MKYQVKANSIAKENATILIKQTSINFGITPQTADNLPNPAELLIGSLSACVLKNLERFSILMKFNYINATISIEANRNDKPPKIDRINYLLKIHSEDRNINLILLKKNIENYGTIYNTLKELCMINGEIEIISI